MKNIHIKYLIVFFLGAFLISCAHIDETNPVSQGDADFSKYVALGNSLTAGYADNALYDKGQLSSFANMIAEKMEYVGGGEFNTPMTGSDNGVNASGEARLVIKGFNDDGTPDIQPVGAGDLSIFSESVAAKGPFNNMGVPGAMATTAVLPGYGMMNPFFGRMTSDPATATMLGDAVSQNPTFFTVFIGNNDILGYATAGGHNPDNDPSKNISNLSDFTNAYQAIVGSFVAAGAKGAIATIPDVTSTPFFTTVPYNALSLKAEQAEQLNGGIDQMLAAIGMDREVLAGMGIDLPVFQEGPNPLFVEDEDPNSLMGIRPMTEDELVLLTAQGYLKEEYSQALGNAQGLFTAIGQALANQDFAQIKVLMQQLAVPDELVLTKDELDKIEKATKDFNAVIKATAQENNLALVDINQFLGEVNKNGIILNSRTVTTDFVTGGAFSLDGIHLTPLGNVLLANEFIQAINTTYNASLPKVDPSNYGGVQFP